MQKTSTKEARRPVPSPLAILLMLTLSFNTTARAAAEIDNPSIERAREHFRKGVAAFADKRFAEAADEFEAAYRSEPAFQVLYNIGQVDVALGRSVEAVEAFEKYLKQGASAIAPERRRDVRGEIDKQAARIGTLRIATNPEGSDIRLDGRLIGRTPLPGPVRVNPGRHTVEAILAAHLAQVREVEVMGLSTISLELTLDPVAPPPAPVAVPAIGAAPRAGAAAARTVVPSPAMAPSPPPSRAGAAGSSSVAWQRIAGITLVAGGLATATIGGLQTYGGANQAIDARDRLVALRDKPATYTQGAWDMATVDYNAGRDRNRRGWIVAGVGAAVLMGGILLVATAPERTSTVALGAWITTDTRGGLVVNGAW